MPLIRPRLTDYHRLDATQAAVDFAIPFLDEDIPLYVDPFLLWKSPSLQDQALHTSVLNAFNHVGNLARKGDLNAAQNILVEASECDEIGLGTSRSRKGKRIGAKTADEIISLFASIPHYEKSGFSHFEEIQFYVENISKDRISDICCSFIKSFLIDFTIDCCEQIGIPLEKVKLGSLYDYSSNKFRHDAEVPLPVIPESREPLILVPKRWLRFVPWISFDEYFNKHCPQDDSNKAAERLDRVRVLRFNRDNFGAVREYVNAKERARSDCENDPLFAQIPITSAKRRLAEILKLPTGKAGGADSKYEDAMVQLLASMFYPHLDFATEQSRTDSGVLIRDLIFYNNRKLDFLNDIYTDFGSQQLVVELKNVASIERDHVNQLNRYLGDNLGRFGVFFTRNAPSRAIRRSLIDLWSGPRRCLLVLTDEDLKLMVNVFETKQREPLDVLKRAYIEFRRSCPS